MEHPLAHLRRPIALVAQGSQPTRAYWLQGALEQLKPSDWFELDPNAPPQPDILSQLGSVVVIRTLPSLWLAALRQLHGQGTQVALLLDDDLLDPKTLAELPWRYRLRLWSGLTRHRQQLHQLVSELWVTTDWLAEIARTTTGLQENAIKHLPLQPPASLLSSRKMHRVAYLATASHAKEWLWLLPLLETLQQRRNDCLLELVLPPAWRRRFRHLPRTRLFYPMDWETYLLDTSNRQVDLLLTPLLSSRFNLGRSPTKFFEAARLGAAGLFSHRAPYAGFVRDGHDGLLLDDAQESWLQAVEQLLENTVQREAIADQCFQRAEALCVR